MLGYSRSRLPDPRTGQEVSDVTTLLAQRGTDTTVCCGCDAESIVYEYGVGDIQTPMPCTCGQQNAGWRWVMWDDPSRQYRTARHAGYAPTFDAAIQSLLRAVSNSSESRTREQEGKSGHV